MSNIILGKILVALGMLVSIYWIIPVAASLSLNKIPNRKIPLKYSLALSIVLESIGFYIMGEIK